MSWLNSVVTLRFNPSSDGGWDFRCSLSNSPSELAVNGGLPVAIRSLKPVG